MRIFSGNKTADVRMHFLRLFAGGVLAGADSPNGFVCNNGFQHGSRREIKEAYFELVLYIFFVIAQLALKGGLSAAEDGRTLVKKCLLHFLIKHLVAFMKVFTALGIPDKDKLDP